MALQTDEFIRLVMLHILPSGFHRNRHFGLLASHRKLADARRLLDVVQPDVEPTDLTATDVSLPSIRSPYARCRAASPGIPAQSTAHTGITHMTQQAMSYVQRHITAKIR